MTNSNKSVNVSHIDDRRLLCDDQDDDDSECWADAKADGDEDSADMQSQQGLETNDGVITRSSVYSVPTFHPPSSHSRPTATNTGSKPALDVSHVQPSTQEDDNLILHKLIFKNDEQKILSMLKDQQQVKHLVNQRDKHGNTALHLACMMGRSKEVISALLNNKWSIDTRNLQRWTPFHEACSYGNREIITLMAKRLKDDVDDALHNSKLSKLLEKTKNYRLVLKWEFQSWVPFVSRVLPNDVCVINKQGKYVRIDTRLLEFEGMFRKKGDSCLVYSNEKWVIMNNKTKKYQYLETPTVYKDIEDKVDEFMATDIMDLEFKSSEMQLTRSTSGWIWKADKVGKVGRFNAALYDFTNVFLVTRKRREHLSQEDLKRNKLAYRSAVHIFKFGEKPNQQELQDAQVNSDQGSQDDDDDQNDDEDDRVIHRESLPPPPPTRVTWEEYISSEAGNFPNLGREQKCKVVKTAVKASVAMSEEFPLSKKELLDLLSITPIKMFKKLKEFVEMKLPDGFPVRLDIPVFPFLTARITFEDFAYHEGPVNESLFSIPQDYELDTNLLPGRFRNNNNSDQGESNEP
jgi:hypothetical protein